MKFVVCFLITVLLSLAGCASGSGYRHGYSEGYLRFEIEPDDVVLEIDERYSGRLEGWVGGVVPVDPGVRRVTVRAEGYMTQRFDIEVAAGEEVTLVLQMEPTIELPEDDEPVVSGSQRLRDRVGVAR